jgi:hypothetical protein
LISSTMVSISARMAVLLGGYVIGCGAARNAPPLTPQLPTRRRYADCGLDYDPIQLNRIIV